MHKSFGTFGSEKLMQCQRFVDVDFIVFQLVFHRGLHMGVLRCWCWGFFVRIWQQSVTRGDPSLEPKSQKLTQIFSPTFGFPTRTPWVFFTVVLLIIWPWSWSRQINVCWRSWRCRCLLAAKAFLEMWRSMVKFNKDATRSVGLDSWKLSQGFFFDKKFPENPKSFPVNIVCIYPNPHWCHGLMSGWDPSFPMGGVGEATGSPAAREGGKGKQWGSVGVSPWNSKKCGVFGSKVFAKRPAKRKWGV